MAWPEAERLGEPEGSEIPVGSSTNRDGADNVSPQSTVQGNGLKYVCTCEMCRAPCFWAPRRDCRYAYLAALRGDDTDPRLLYLRKIVSEHCVLCAALG